MEIACLVDECKIKPNYIIFFKYMQLYYILLI